LKYFDLSAFSFAFSGVVFSSAMFATPSSKGREAGLENEKSHLGRLRNVVFESRQPPLRAGGGFLQNAFYDE
jgi:hypothetical protein